MDTLTHILDIYPVGQLESFGRIRSCIKLKLEEATTTKICWTTEWLSDLKEGIVKELLRAKKDFIDNFPKEGYLKTMNEIKRLAP
mmetsp:Transcript_16222/g.15619  ORF Transcript_16222/g.15619 Transcript_16222/m.15619 type:complete len:85 (-) Transcript_16222:300-554(-)